MNLLILKPKGSDFGLINYNWFEVGHDTDDEYVKYSVKQLIDSVNSYTTDILPKYVATSLNDLRSNLETNEVCFKHTVDIRIERMVKWGWKFANYTPKDI